MAELRVGVLIDEWRAPRWVRGVIERIQASSVARVVVVVKNATPPRHDLGEILAGRGRHLLYHLYRRVDDLVFRRRETVDDALAPQDLRPAVRGLPVIETAPLRTARGLELADDAADAIAAQRLDVLLQLGFVGLAGRVLALPRHGVWSYDHVESEHEGFREVLEEQPTTVSTLRARDEAGERVIYRSWSGTDQHSLARSRVNRYAKSAEFVLRKLRDLQGEGPAALAEVPDAAPPPRRDPPDNREIARGLVRLAGRFAHDKWMQWRRGEQWVLAYEASPAGGAELVPDRLTYLVPPADRFWADPFPVAHEGGWYLFFEEYEHEKRRGRIALIALDRDGRCSPAEPVLEGATHFSYPCVFRWRQHWLMVPETSTRRTVELYRATRFPDRWEKCGTPLSGIRAADTTIAEIDGRWWLFTCMAEEGALASDELFLFHADSPFGPFTPHRRNPVKSDVRSARPAGRVYLEGGAWHRPAQDCAGRYGRATVINRIEKLTPDEYAERTVARIEPGWNPRIIGTHTYNRAGDLTVVDALRLR